MLVGIDLDNTIICYDGVLHSIALERGVIGPDIPVSKRAVRDEVRAKFNDDEWQKLQIAIYGESIDRAELMPGVLEFLQEINRRGWSFKIISHKTRYPNYGNVRIDLREAALHFLEQKGFFAEDGLGMNPGDVHFLSTRREKVDRICELGCDLFIDDLVEVFEDEHFPENVTAILFSAENRTCDLEGGLVFDSFSLIMKYLFYSGEEL